MHYYLVLFDVVQNVANKIEEIETLLT